MFPLRYDSEACLQTPFSISYDTLFCCETCDGGDTHTYVCIGCVDIIMCRGRKVGVRKMGRNLHNDVVYPKGIQSLM